jgi:hypothetical protein
MVRDGVDQRSFTAPDPPSFDNEIGFRLRLRDCRARCHYIFNVGENIGHAAPRIKSAISGSGRR